MTLRAENAAIRNLRYANLLLATAAVANALRASTTNLLVVLHLAALRLAASRLTSASVLFAATIGSEAARHNVFRSVAVDSKASAEHERSSNNFPVHLSVSSFPIVSDW